jgi:hypothetical protein
MKKLLWVAAILTSGVVCSGCLSGAGLAGFAQGFNQGAYGAPPAYYPYGYPYGGGLSSGSRPASSGTICMPNGGIVGGFNCSSY